MEKRKCLLRLYDITNRPLLFNSDSARRGIVWRGLDSSQASLVALMAKPYRCHLVGRVKNAVPAGLWQSSRAVFIGGNGRASPGRITSAGTLIKNSSPDYSGMT